MDKTKGLEVNNKKVINKLFNIGNNRKRLKQLHSLKPLEGGGDFIG